MLSILNQSLDLVGKRELAQEQLQEFIRKTLEHEVKELTFRRESFNKKELENETKINDFEFYSDGYRVGVFIELKEDNILPFKDEDGNDIQVMQLFKKNKDKEFVLDENEKKIPTGRCIMKIKTRKGYMSIFIGLKKVEAIDQEHFYVLVGGMSTKWKVANSEEYEKHSKKKEGVEYTDYPEYTLNAWQLGEIAKTKGGKLKIITPDVNWKKEEEEDK